MDEEKAAEESEQPMRIVKNWKRPEKRSVYEKDPTKYGISPITGELIPLKEAGEHMRISLIDPKYKEQKERMYAKIRENTLASDEEISRNIEGLARTRPDIFGTTEEEVFNAVKAEIAKKREEKPKQVIWDGHSGSIGRTANQALSQTLTEEQNDAANAEARNLPGPAALPPKPGVLPLRPFPPPPGLAINLSRPPAGLPYPASNGGIIAPPPPPQRPQMMPMVPGVQPNPLLPITSGQQPIMVRPPLPPSITVGLNPPPAPPGSQFTPPGVPRPFMPMQIPPPSMSMVPPPPLPQGIPPPPEEAPPPLPDEPEPKRQRVGDSQLTPEDQFLAQHLGSVRISIAVPNTDEGNLKGQLLEITIKSV